MLMNAISDCTQRDATKRTDIDGANLDHSTISFVNDAIHLLEVVRVGEQLILALGDGVLLGGEPVSRPSSQRADEDVGCDKYFWVEHTLKIIILGRRVDAEVHGNKKCRDEVITTREMTLGMAGSEWKEGIPDEGDGTCELKNEGQIWQGESKIWLKAGCRRETNVWRGKPPKVSCT
jgi:hypothetical protein